MSARPLDPRHCPECGLQHPCSMCGVPPRLLSLVASCADCGSPAAHGYSLCGACLQSLGRLAEQERCATLAQLVDPALAARIRGTP